MFFKILSKFLNRLVAKRLLLRLFKNLKITLIYRHFALFYYFFKFNLFIFNDPNVKTLSLLNF